jgi:hypothetical protein
LKLYRDTINSSTFLADRAKNVTGSDAFDRQAYLDTLLQKYREWKVEKQGLKDPHPTLPEEYTTYILEWPEKAIINGLWPGIHPQAGGYFDRGQLFYPRIWDTEVLFSPIPGRTYCAEEARNPDSTPVLLPLLPVQGLGMGYSVFLLLEDFDHDRSTHHKVKAGQMVMLGPVQMIISAKITTNPPHIGTTWLEYLQGLSRRANVLCRS